MSEKEVQVPCQADQITPAWISSVLKVPVKVDTFKLTKNINAGIGFLSSMSRVEFEVDKEQEEGGSGKKQDKYSLIVKLLADSTNPGARELSIAEGLDKAEIKCYTDLFKEISQEIPDFSKFFCEYYYARIQEADPSQGLSYESVLILKDLRPEGYAVVPFHQGYDRSLFAEGLDFTAKLHVGARCLERTKGGRLPEVYPWLSTFFLPIEDQPAPDYVPQLYYFFDEGFEATIKLLGESSKSPEKYIPAYEAMRPRAEELYQLILKAGKAFPCGIHGDLWSPNILVNQEKGEAEGRMKIIDWQFFGYSDPAFDLSIFIFTLLPMELLTPGHIAEAVRSYYTLYIELCKAKTLPVERSLEEFQIFFNTYGIAYYLYVAFSGCGVMLRMEDAVPKLVRIFELFVDMDVIAFLLSLPGL